MVSKNQQSLVLVGPGKLGKEIARMAILDYPEEYFLFPTMFGRTERKEQIAENDFLVLGHKQFRNNAERIVRDTSSSPIFIDCSKDAIVEHAQIFCELGCNFIMLSTGEGVDDVKSMVKLSGITAIQDVNMSPGLMTLYGSIIRAAENNNKGFQGYTYKIDESHQASKDDVSGTALKIGRILKSLGAIPAKDPYREGIYSERDPKKQLALGVPEEHLDGHAYHEVILEGPCDETLFFGSNILGHETYGYGTLAMATPFLMQKITNGEIGHYSMTEVLAA